MANSCVGVALLLSCGIASARPEAAHLAHITRWGGFDTMFAHLADPEQSPPDVARTMEQLSRELDEVGTARALHFAREKSRIEHAVHGLPVNSGARRRLADRIFSSREPLRTRDRMLRVMGVVGTLATRIDERGPLAPRLLLLGARAWRMWEAEGEAQRPLYELATGFDARWEPSWTTDWSEEYAARCIVLAASRLDLDTMHACEDVAPWDGYLRASEIFARDVVWQPSLTASRATP